MKIWNMVALLALAQFIVGPFNPIDAMPDGATFTVTSLVDNPDAAPGNGTCADSGGGCTLRAAVMEANALAGADTIILLADTYTLTRTGADEDDANTGDLDIKGTLTISGAGPATTIIDAHLFGDRVFQILSSANATISGVTIRGGYVSGTISDSGGGILNMGILHISNSVIEYNDSQFGGGIFNTGKHENTGTLTLTTSMINYNSASGDGGGIYNQQGSVTIDASAVVTNTAGSFGGGIVSDFNLSLTDSTVAGNSARAGGGIQAAGTLNLSHSTVRNNTAYLEGAGLVAGSVSANIESSTFHSNHADSDGGGIQITGSSSVQLTNSTVSDNYSNTSGGGIKIEGGTLDAFNATIAGNIADWDDNGTDIGGGIRQTGGTVSLRNTILDANYHAENMFAIKDDCDGTIALLYYSLLGTTANCTITTDTASVTSQSAGLLSLADNGGPTRTRALGADSPAVDRADPNGCKDVANHVLKYDQRGFFRAVDGDGNGSAMCDMGAYEFGSSAPYIYLPLILRGG